MKAKKIFLSFWAFVLYFVIIFGVVTALLMGRLEDYLVEYEYYQPTTLSDKVLGYFKTGDISALEALPNIGEEFRGDNFAEFLNAVLDKEDLFCYKSSTAEDTLTYDYISANKKLASLVLKKTGEISANKLDIYAIDGVIWYPHFSYTVTAPEDCKVYINGELLDSEGELVETFDTYNDFDGFTKKTYKYTVDGLVYVTDVRAEAEGSGSVTVSEFGRADGSEYVVSQIMPDDMKSELDALTREAVDAYIHYTTYSFYSVNTVLRYIHKNAPLYNFLKNFNNTWNHSNMLSEEFLKFDITDFVYYDDTHASLRTDVIYKMTKYGGYTEEFDFNFDLYYVKEDGAWYIALMERVIK